MHESTFGKAVTQFMQALRAEQGCLKDMEKSEDALESRWAHKQLDALHLVEVAIKYYNETVEEG